MKAKLILLIIMAISINSYPFLRKLADTKESCEKAGKEYQEGKPAQCKTGNTIFEVETESDCKKGEWTADENGFCSATADPVLSKDKCTGTPTYTEAVINSPATCKVGSKEISATESETACKEAVKWTDAKCNVDKISNENCQSSKITWTDEVGTCKIGSSVTFNSVSQTECNSITVSWEGADEDSKECIVKGYTNCATEGVFSLVDSKCSISKETIASETDCKKPGWETTTSASCKAGEAVVLDINSKDKCDELKSKISLTEGSCSISEVSEEDCKKGATYTAAVKTPAKCLLGEIEIKDPERLLSKSACETALFWQKGTCTNAKVTNEEDCESDPTFTAATEAKCVSKENDSSSKSNSSFLVFNFVLALAIGLLF